MRYDFALINELCGELGLSSRIRSSDLLEVELGQGAVLCFQNTERDKDCLVGFEGTPWHTHDNFMFDDGHGIFIEMDHLDILTGLKEGKILICELLRQGEIVDRWLVHCEYNDELNYLEQGEEIRVRRAKMLLNPK